MISRTFLADGAGHRVAAEGIEMDAVGERTGDFRCGHHGRQGGAVADALGHGHDVGNHFLGFEPPEALAGAAEPGLDLVGDAQAAGGPHVFVGLFEVAVGIDHRAPDPLDGFGKESRHFTRGGILDQAANVLGVFGAGRGIVKSPGAPVGIGAKGVVDAEAVGVVVLPGAVGPSAPWPRGCPRGRHCAWATMS